MARLYHRQPVLDYHDYPVTTTRLSVGRHENNDVVLPDTNVSGYHARIEFADGVFYVEDLISTNGTTVNGETIARRALKDGDVIRIGTHELLFEAGPPEEWPEARGSRQAPLSEPREEATAFVRAGSRTPPGIADKPARSTKRRGLLGWLFGRN